MKENLFTIIEGQYENFSKTNKKIADYILKNANEVSFMSIKELESEIGASTASISRFTKTIGFNGYSDFQKSLSKLILKNVVSMQEVKTSIEKSDTFDILKNIISDNLLTLENLYTDDLQREFNKMLEIISFTKGNIYIIASRSSYTVAYYLYFMLGSFMKNVRLLSDAQGTLSLQLIHITNQDSLIAISYSKYSKVTSDVVDYFYNKECNITLITDSYTSPISSKASQLLVGKNQGMSYGFVGAMAIANAIVVAVGSKNKIETVEYMNVQDEISDLLDIYY